MDVFDDLRNAIVQQAVVDYEAAFMGSRVAGKNPTDTMRECEEFFHSGWYAELTDGAIDGDWLAQNVKIRALKKAEKAYEAMLDPFNRTTIRATVSLPRGKGGKTPQSMSFIFPPRFASAIMDLLSAQIETIQAELSELEEKEA